MVNLIVNADDFGISNEVNEAIKYCFMKKYINQTTIMVNMPCSDAAIRIAKESDFMTSVGLHLNLVEGIPLTEGIRHTKLCDKDGVFNGSIMSNKKNRIWLDSKTSKYVEVEIEEQIKKYLSYGIGNKHLDSHQHSHTNPSVIRLLLPLLKKYEFNSVRLSRNISKSHINYVKKLYKQYFNKKISSFNKSYSRYASVIYFGSMDDIAYFDRFPNVTGGIEMMVHPIMKNSTLMEAYGNLDLETWWEMNNTKFCLEILGCKG